MKLNSLNAISPIDGRYSEKCRKLSNYFSEESLIKYRVLVEIEYFLKLTESNIPNFKFNHYWFNTIYISTARIICWLFN